MNPRIISLAGAAIALSLSLGISGCGKKTCEDAAKNMVQLKHGDRPDEEKKKEIEQRTKECTEMKMSQEALDCFASAKDKDGLDKCKPGK